MIMLLMVQIILQLKFLINDLSLKYKKFLVTGAISKFDGHIFTFNFNDKKKPCLRCFYQEETISDDILNCEYEGILGTVAGIIGTMQANEIIKKNFKYWSKFKWIYFNRRFVKFKL